MNDLTRAAEEFFQQGELVYLDHQFSADRLAEFVDEAERLEPEAIRVHVPLVRRGGTIGRRQLRRRAPQLASLYHELIDAVSTLVGRPLYDKDEDDDHSMVMYCYRAGDFMRMHRDRCGSADGASYSFTVGLVDESTSRLQCRVAGRNRSIANAPGSLTVYNGSRVPHAVSRLGPGQRRVVLSGSYRTGPTPDVWHKRLQDVTEGLLYFGLRGLIRR